jgi:hypothetical protein
MPKQIKKGHANEGGITASAAIATLPNGRRLFFACRFIRSGGVAQKPTKNYPPLPGIVLPQTREVTGSNY